MTTNYLGGLMVDGFNRLVDELAAAPVAGPWDVRLREYHEDRTAESHSSLEVFAESVRRYHAIYVAKTLARPEATKPQRLGTALHALLLQPDQLEELVAIGPEGKTRQHKAWDEFAAQNEGKVLLTSDEWDSVEGMKRAVLEHPVAEALLFQSSGRNEFACRWQDPETGIWLKSCFDRLLDLGPIIDIKTARDPNPLEWAKDVANFGYYRQAALYRQGRATLGLGGYFLHVVVGNVEPFDVAVVEMEPDAFELGDRENAAILRQLQQCRESGCWESKWQQGVEKLKLPRWAYTKGDDR
jgi:exodeoxyribonuclease VIII